MPGIPAFFIDFRFNAFFQATLLLLHIRLSETAIFQRRLKQHGPQKRGAFSRHILLRQRESVIDAGHGEEQRLRFSHPADIRRHPSTVQFIETAIQGGEIRISRTAAAQQKGQDGIARRGFLPQRQQQRRGNPRRLEPAVL